MHQLEKLGVNLSMSGQRKNRPGRKAALRPTVVTAEFVQAGAPYRWKKGQSGNPTGKPVTQKLSAAIRDKLSCCVPKMGGITYAELIADVLAKKAASGDVTAAQFLADRSEGKPAQSIALDVNQLAEKFSSMSREQLTDDGKSCGHLPAIFAGATWPQALYSCAKRKPRGGYEKKKCRRTAVPMLSRRLAWGIFQHPAHWRDLRKSRRRYAV